MPAGAVALFAGLFAATAVHLSHEPRWYPVLDLALTEMRIRDVWSANPPMVGLIGRIGSGSVQGSHPGPLSFYLLWPLYQLFGGSAWAMEAATCTANVIAIAIALWCAFRRGGAWMVAGLTAAVMLVIFSLGPVPLIQPWNPYLPILWWITFVCAVWCVVGDDLVALPVAVFAGSLCVQTHISYTLLVGSLAVVVVASLLWRWWSGRGTASPRGNRRGWVLGSVALGVVLWLPPLIEQVRAANGNLGIVWNHFTNPPQSPIGFAAGGRLLLRHLDVAKLVRHGDGTTGPVLAGVVLLVVWIAAAAVAWWQRHHVLTALNALLAVSLAAGLVSLSRIFGPPFWYLMLWGWSLAALMLLSVGGSVGVLAVRYGRGHLRVVRIIGATVLVAVTLAATIGYLRQMRRVTHPSSHDSATLAAVAPRTIAAMRAGSVPGGGPAGHYFVTWYDPIGLGGIGYGLLDELERAGFDVGTSGVLRVAVTGHRVMPMTETTAEVHLAFGDDDIARWRANPKVVEVAAFDPRTGLQRALSAQLRREAVAGIRAAGYRRPARVLERQAFALLTDPRLSPAAQRAVSGYLALGLPVASFVAPPGSFDKAR